VSEVEPSHPSEAFIEWYHLDGIIQRRQTWQRTDALSPLPQLLLASLANSAQDLWALLEQKAIIVEYV